MQKGKVSPFLDVQAMFSLLYFGIVDRALIRQGGSPTAPSALYVILSESGRR